MKKTILLTAAVVLMFSCSKKENIEAIEDKAIIEDYSYKLEAVINGTSINFDTDEFLIYGIDKREIRGTSSEINLGVKFHYNANQGEYNFNPYSSEAPFIYCDIKENGVYKTYTSPYQSGNINIEVHKDVNNTRRFIKGTFNTILKNSQTNQTINVRGSFQGKHHGEV